MNDQILTQQFILWQLPICLTQSRFAGSKSRQVRPVEAGYEYDEHELAEELVEARRRQPLRKPVQVDPEDFEAAYGCFLG
jgi:hypothetical protein